VFSELRVVREDPRASKRPTQGSDLFSILASGLEKRFRNVNNLHIHDVEELDDDDDSMFDVDPEEVSKVNWSLDT
jgi:hypothetical protein